MRTFMIATPGGFLRLRAATAKDAKDWIEAVKRCADGIAATEVCAYARHKHRTMHPGDGNGNGGAHSNAVPTVYWNHQEATGVTRPAMVRLTLPSTLKGGRRSLANLGATVTVTKPAAVQKLDAELSAAELVKRYGTVAMTRVTHTHQ